MGIGVKLTASLEYFLCTKYPEKFVLISFGHMEEFTEDIKNEYVEWVKTDEAKPYLKGGANYHEPR